MDRGHGDCPGSAHRLVPLPDVLPQLPRGGGAGVAALTARQGHAGNDVTRRLFPGSGVLARPDLVVSPIVLVQVGWKVCQ